MALLNHSVVFWQCHKKQIKIERTNIKKIHFTSPGCICTPQHRMRVKVRKNTQSLRDNQIFSFLGLGQRWFITVLHIFRLFHQMPESVITIHAGDSIQINSVSNKLNPLYRFEINDKRFEIGPLNFMQICPLEINVNLHNLPKSSQPTSGPKIKRYHADVYDAFQWYNCLQRGVSTSTEHR